MRIYLMQSYPRFARVVWSEEAHQLYIKKKNYFPALESQRRVSGRLSWGMPQHLKEGGRSAKRQLTQLLCILKLKYPNKNKREKLRLYSLALSHTRSTISNSVQTFLCTVFLLEADRICLPAALFPCILQIPFSLSLSQYHYNLIFLFSRNKKKKKLSNGFLFSAKETNRY